MTKLKITVTKEILEKSKNCGYGSTEGKQSTNCAIALAVKDLFPKARVSTMHVIYDDSYDHFTTLPLCAINFISKFDKTNPNQRPMMDPITFEIEIPEEVINSINIDELKPLLVNHPTLELIEL